MQRYLLDTQVLIWALTSPSKLTAKIVDLLSANAICISSVSMLEIAIKQKIGKLPEMPISINELETIILRDGLD